jgi:hypothetical protein
VKGYIVTVRRATTEGECAIVRVNAASREEAESIAQGLAEEDSAARPLDWMDDSTDRAYSVDHVVEGDPFNHPDNAND